MNIYEEFEALRDIISEDDQVICGLKTGTRDETMRRKAMSTMTAMDVAEDENRSDSETVFFFVNESDARACFTQAVNLGLVSGEVTFDPTVSESYGVGKYCVRFAPHVQIAKREVLFTLWNKGVGGRGTPRQYEDWQRETGGALMVAEDAFAQASQASGVNHKNGNFPMAGDPVFAISKPESRDAGPDPVHGLTDKTVGRYPAAWGGASDPSEGAFQTYHNAAHPNAGASHDFVHDGTNGTPMTGGEGAQQNVSIPAGAAHVSRNSHAESSDGSTLSEELRTIANMPGGVDELRSLLE